MISLENRPTLRQMRLVVLCVLPAACFLDYGDFEAKLANFRND